jgi:hypothetical protein
MPTYLELQNRIANEMQRPDLFSGAPSSPIQLAIQDAVRHFKNESFYLNKKTTSNLHAWSWVADASRLKEDRGNVDYAAYLTTIDPDPAVPRTLSPTPDKTSDSLPTDFSQEINLSIAKDNTVYSLTRVSYDEIVSMDAIYAPGDTAVTPHLSTPTYWTYMPLENSVGAIRVYPRADKSYTLLLAYQASLAAPKTDSDSVFWTNDAYRMIKSYAKAVLYADYLQQFELAQANEQMAESEYNRLVTSSEARAFPDTVKGHTF